MFAFCHCRLIQETRQRESLRKCVVTMATVSHYLAGISRVIVIRDTLGKDVMTVLTSVNQGLVKMARPVLMKNSRFVVNVLKDGKEHCVKLVCLYILTVSS